ncbi:hypothetical protein AALO_G00152000 [Alosa alosa]|uniref:Uncharacterized protein n=1 Tax=Alosa alosa TaxID=278164 RepID=A0AAV6GEC6_9TELE|nr:hypothetical protein AALO_G00152000 [Alosa alosa]
MFNAEHPQKTPIQTGRGSNCVDLKTRGTLSGYLPPQRPLESGFVSEYTAGEKRRAREPHNSQTYNK